MVRDAPRVPRDAPHQEGGRGRAAAHAAVSSLTRRPLSYSPQLASSFLAMRLAPAGATIVKGPQAASATNTGTMVQPLVSIYTPAIRSLFTTFLVTVLVTDT